ncbi:hypothetical protein D3C77_802470 [compost metagenome]
MGQWDFLPGTLWDVDLDPVVVLEWPGVEPGAGVHAHLPLSDGSVQVGHLENVPEQVGYLGCR